MAFKELPALTRRQPLMRTRYNDLLSNQREIRDLLLREHKGDGTHNLMRAPRAVATVRCTAGVWSLVGSSPGISSVSDGGLPGESNLTLSSSYFTDADSITPILAPAASGATIPRFLNWTVNSATSIEVASLGFSAGALGAVDGSYFVALYAQPVTHTPTTITTEPMSAGDAHLTAARYNALIDNSLGSVNLIAAEHTSAGGHANREFASTTAFIEWTGAAYFTGAGTYVTYAHGAPGSLSRVSAGIIDVTIGNVTLGTGNTNPVNFDAQVFIRVKAAAGEHWTATVDESSITNDGVDDFTGFRVHLWKRTSTNTWALTDGSFWYSFHCSHAES